MFYTMPFVMGIVASSLSRFTFVVNNVEVRNENARLQRRRAIVTNRKEKWDLARDNLMSSRESSERDHEVWLININSHEQHKEGKRKLFPCSLRSLLLHSRFPFASSTTRDFAHCFKVNFIFVFLSFLLSPHISIRASMDCRILGLSGPTQSVNFEC